MKTKAVCKSETNKHSKVGHEIVFKSIFFVLSHCRLSKVRVSTWQIISLLQPYFLL